MRVVMLNSFLTGGNSSDIKSQNISAILLCLLQKESIARVQLAQILGVSNATISNLVAELSTAGLIVETGSLHQEGQVGRPQRSLQLVPNSRFVLSVHIDVGTVYIGLCNLLGQIIDRKSFSHALTDSAETVLSQIVSTIKALLSTQNKPILGIGLAASGLVDVEQGINIFSPNLGWKNVPIRQLLEAELTYPVFVDNNVRAMAFGEAMFGSARTMNALAFLYVRVGLGAGFVLNGRLYRGAAAGAGEIGHNGYILDASRKPISLESLVSEPVLLKLAHEITGENLSFRQVADMAKAGHEALRSLLEDRAFYLGIAAANLVNTLNPEAIVLGGIVRQAEETMLPIIEETVKSHSFADLGQRVQLRTPSFGRDAGMVGAAALALDAYFYRPIPKAVES